MLKLGNMTIGDPDNGKSIIERIIDEGMRKEANESEEDLANEAAEKVSKIPVVKKEKRKRKKI